MTSNYQPLTTVPEKGALINRIFLCRHGETEANAKGLLQGSGVDLDLNTTQSLGVQNLYLRDNSFANKISSPIQSSPATRLISESQHDACIDNLYDIEHQPTDDGHKGYYYFDHIKPPSVAGNLKLGLRKKEEVQEAIAKATATEVEQKMEDLKKELELAKEREKRYLLEIDGLKTRNSLESQIKESDTVNQTTQLKFNIENLQRQSDFSVARIDELSRNNAETARLLEDTTNHLEQSHSTNKLLMEKLTFLDKSLQSTTKHAADISRECDSLKLWKECQQEKLQDYEACIKHLHSAFSEDIVSTFPPKGPALAHYIASLIDTKQELQKQNQKLSKEKDDLDAKLQGAVEKYLRESEQTKAHLKSETDKLELSSLLTARLKESCENKERENIELSIKLQKTQEELKSQRLQLEEDGIEVRERSVTQLKVLREQFERDRLEFKISLDKLQREKLDLQTEVGQLLRDRRTFTLDQYRVAHLTLTK